VPPGRAENTLYPMRGTVMATFLRFVPDLDARALRLGADPEIDEKAPSSPTERSGVSGVAEPAQNALTRPGAGFLFETRGLQFEFGLPSMRPLFFRSGARTSERATASACVCVSLLSPYTVSVSVGWFFQPSGWCTP